MKTTDKLFTSYSLIKLPDDHLEFLGWKTFLLHKCCALYPRYQGIGLFLSFSVISKEGIFLQ